MFISFSEVIDMIIMTFAVGYIFMSSFRLSSQSYGIHYGFDWKAFRTACIVAAPALLLHELSHKFVALSYGFTAEFNAAYLFLGLGVLLAAMNSGFIFFVPAYVSIGCASVQCSISPLQSALIAGAGPFMNLIIFAAAFAVLRSGMKMKKSTRIILYFTKQINLFLFVFNILPIPGFDGAKFFAGIFQILF